MTDDEIRDVFAELRRIGVDLGRPPGLALGTGFRDGEFLPWLRALPDNLGHDAFVERLNAHVNAAQPIAVSVVPTSPGGRPHRLWPTIEQMHAGIDVLVHEWDPLGARLGELSNETVMHHAYNALAASLSGEKPEVIEGQIAALLGSVEDEVFGLRPSPLEQRRYLARRIMQVVVDQPGPSHEHNPWDEWHRAIEESTKAGRAAGRITETHTRNGGSCVARIGPRGYEPPALDPGASCTECGATGTVAKVMREVEPVVSRYCPACWSSVRDKYWGRYWRPRQKPEDRSTPEGMIAAFDRIYDDMMTYAVERPYCVGSAMWEDRVPFLRAALGPNEGESPDDRERHLRQLARDLVAEAHRMYGPMPPEIEAFVQQYSIHDA